MFNLFHRHNFKSIGFSHLYENYRDPTGPWDMSRVGGGYYILPVSIKAYRCFNCGKIKHEKVYGHIKEWSSNEDMERCI